MPAKVIDVSQARTAGDLRDVVHHAVQALVEGHVVAFPTETVYGLAASGLNADAVDRLAEIKGRKSGQPFALAVKSLDDARDYIPEMSLIAQRLARRCWPGPLTLVLQNGHVDGLAHRLPEPVRRLVCPEGTVGFRVPAAPLLIEALRLVAGPLVLTSANRTGQPEALTGDEVKQAVGDDIRLILNDGKCQFGQPSTVVKVEDRRVQVLRQGVISTAHLKRLSSTFVLFVCTGNTCRSPMAAALFRQMVADRLGCKTDEIEDRGVIVASAGIAAMTGGGATPEAVAATAGRGAALDDHISQPLREQLVRHADHIFTMTQTHRHAILTQWPEAAARTHVLCPDGRDVSDPIGGSAELYERCADQIAELLRARLEQLDLGGVEVREP
ncbi:MAG: threonylcarbamoyl-AMP synthase [Planctomycetales bacterium]|nr:threonylcarbamoyl-AMP synthase [Planctomycetales bacterium]